ncbi:chemotaxis protein CheX [Halanaerocella petrolearia]
MKTEYIDPIFIATNQVLKNMFELEADKDEITTEEDVIATKKANISIGVTGDLRGRIIFSFSEELALKIVTEMSGMEIDQLDKFVTSAIGELANIISGHAMTNLEEVDYECDITPPQVMIGEGEITSLDVNQVLNISLQTEIGQFDINLAVEEV